LGRALVRLVKSPGESRSGFEGAGVVTAVGSDVHEWRVGDRVGVLPSSFDVVHDGACAESMTVPVAALVATPQNIDDRDAGSIWMQCLTAWGALVEIAEDRKPSLRRWRSRSRGDSGRSSSAAPAVPR
jgi:NADPH:quinone reductase-like Zn-dependent oxidoreductase